MYNATHDIGTTLLSCKQSHYFCSINEGWNIILRCEYYIDYDRQLGQGCRKYDFKMQCEPVETMCKSAYLLALCERNSVRRFFIYFTRGIYNPDRSSTPF